MTEHKARIEWTCSGDFVGGRYSRAHLWSFDGGAVVRASAAAQNVTGPFTDPAAVDPEEALVAAVSSCHMLWFLWLAAAAKWDVASYADDAVGVLGKDERGLTAITRVALRPTIVYGNRAPREDEVRELHRRAHEHCFIANTLRCDVVVESCSPSD
jgi:organic hydroperoxide reductase OsmC/OhrA